MRCSTEPRYRKFVKGYSFLSFSRKSGDKYGKKLIDTATKTLMDAARTASKRVVQKTAEATGDLIGNKIADKITSWSQTKSKEKKKKIEKQEIKKKDSKLLMTWDCFRHYIKIENQKITNLLGTAANEMPRFVTKKWVEFHDPSGDANNSYKLSKLIRSKTSMLRSDLCNFSDVYIFVKGTITVTNPDNDDKKQQDVFGITTEMNQIRAGGGADNNINYSIKDSKSFDYKTSIIGKLEGKTQKKKKLKLFCH